MKVTEKIQHIINILSQNDNKITTLPTSYKKAVKMITENRIFGIELIHIEDDILGKGKDWIKKVSYYKVIRHEY